MKSMNLDFQTAEVSTLSELFASVLKVRYQALYRLGNRLTYLSYVVVAVFVESCTMSWYAIALGSKTSLSDFM